MTQNVCCHVTHVNLWRIEFLNVPAHAPIWHHEAANKRDVPYQSLIKAGLVENLVIETALRTIVRFMIVTLGRYQSIET